MNIIIMSGIAFIWLLIAFVFVIRLKKYTDGTLFEWPTKIVFTIPFVICDWLYNITVFTIVFLDLPDEWDETVTKRMKRYKQNYNIYATGIKKFRYVFAIRLCDFLSKHDIGHC